MLVIRIYRLRRRKRQYAKSYASLSTYFPSQSNISSPTELHSLTNPLYISPYQNSSFFDKLSSLHYESQELTMELFPKILRVSRGWEQWCPAVGARGSAAPIVFQLVGAPLPYFVNIFELVNDKYCTI